MALTHFAFGRLATGPAGDDVAGTLVFDTVVSEGIAPTSTSQATMAAAPQPGGGRPVCLISTDAAVYVAFGASPDAGTAARRIMVPANATVTVLVNGGDKAAVRTI